MSAEATSPQALPSRVQNDETDSGVHDDAQVFEAVHVVPLGQEPQVSVRGWLVQGSTSVTLPQTFPT